MCILDRTQGDMSSLKNQPNAYNMYTDWKESVCLFIFLKSDSLLGVVHFCRYVHEHMYIYYT